MLYTVQQREVKNEVLMIIKFDEDFNRVLDAVMSDEIYEMNQDILAELSNVLQPSS